jgi:hypothetical protein
LYFSCSIKALAYLIEGSLEVTDKEVGIGKKFVNLVLLKFQEFIRKVLEIFQEKDIVEYLSYKNFPQTLLLIKNIAKSVSESAN